MKTNLRKFSLFFIVVIFSLCLINGTVFAGAWEELAGSATGGGVSNTLRYSVEPSLALDSSGYPHIAWFDFSIGSGEIDYSYWDGTQWTTHGVVSGTEGYSSKPPSLALDSSGYPHIAWYDDPGFGDPKEIYYAYWDGTSWTTHGGANTGGGVSNNAGGSMHPSLALDSNNYPHIAWQDAPGGYYQIYYAYWDGNSWETLGSANTGGGVSNNTGGAIAPSLALDYNGYPHIAWCGSSGGDLEIYYAYWDGTSWMSLGNINVSNNTGESYEPSLALDSGGYPHIAWQDAPGGYYQIYYAYWDGNSWETLGSANTGGGVSNNTGGAIAPSLALDSIGNPHIAWMDGASEIYYVYWNGTNWVTHGNGNTGGGVSNNAGDSGNPSLALDSSGNPHITWNDSSGGNTQIYYRYWNPLGVITTTTTSTTTSTTTTITTTSTTTTTFVCWCPADSFLGCVSGQVTDVDTGEPLAGKKVRFKGRLFPGGPRFNMRTQTDDNGCYQFNLPDGIGKIWVKRCRGGGRKEVSVPFGGKVNNVNFECR